ncbi:hypothetical protein Hypma_002575 [Hypsizygus marmoreus]|uniref:Inhibitor I9 domain-containing protein n=1 Tax=Hypsizygus marmoreus TaxID=39966 RepID=A0A369J6E6_HYPMA|nr:hypothetical protein Hypma_002575 [Hypsizygus marmoreus]
MHSKKVIVIFKDFATRDEIHDLMESIKDHGGRITNVYRDLFKGFAAVVSHASLLRLESLARIRDTPIDYVETDEGVTSFVEL